MTSFGEKIKALREQRDLTQEQLAELVGVHQTQISHCEKGARKMSIPLIEKLAVALRTDADDLISDWVSSRRERQVA